MESRMSVRVVDDVHSDGNIREVVAVLIALQP
jgi:hypothetical protein